MIYSPATGLHRPLSQKKIIYAEYFAVSLVALLSLLWIELLFYSATSHFTQFPIVTFTHPGSSVAPHGQTTTVRSGSKNWSATSSPTTWSLNGNLPAAGGYNGGPWLSPGSVVPDSNSGLPIPLPYTVTTPKQSLQLDGKPVLGTSPIGITLN
jgi:hypothetical protein